MESPVSTVEKGIEMTLNLPPDRSAPRRRPWLHLAMAILMGLPALSLLAACGDDMPTGPPERERRRSSGAAETAEEPAQAATARFADFDSLEEYVRPDYPTRRNPFQPDVDVLGTQQEEAAMEEIRPQEPLEQFAVSSLNLVTIISDTTVPKAMFVDPTGYGHFAKEGDRIGRNNGIIRAIRQNEVEIREGDEQGSVVRVRMRERELRTGDRGLTDEEREALRRLMGTAEGQELLQQMGGPPGDAEQQPRPQDDRFSDLLPPGRRQ